MKIVHVCLASFYIDEFSYQENILPKYHKILLYDVVIIASTISFDDKGSPCLLEQKELQYISSDGIKVIRLKYKSFPFSVNKILRRYSNFYSHLKEEAPDIIFVHGCQFADIVKIRKYKLANPHVSIFVDNHADFINSGRSFISKYILHKVIWKFFARIFEPYVTQFWGVTPLRSDFLHDVYGIDKSKIDTLIMGVDLLAADFDRKNVLRDEYRMKLGCQANDFVIISGGKIDREKQIDKLIRAFRSINCSNFKLIIFGTISRELETDYIDLISNDIRISNIGWQSPSEIYKYLYAADLAVYPGTHSVLWEQTIGVGVPTIIRKWKGFHHLEVNESVIALESTSEENLRKHIIDAYVNISDLKTISSRNHEIFSYENIATKSINI